MSESLASAHWLAANAALIIFLAVVHFSVMSMLIVVFWNALHDRAAAPEPLERPEPVRWPTSHPVFAAAEPTEQERARLEPPRPEVK